MIVFYFDLVGCWRANDKPYRVCLSGDTKRQVADRLRLWAVRTSCLPAITMLPYVQPLSTPCSRLARLPVLNPGNGWKTSWCACLPILATSECYFRATGRKSQRLAASSIQLSESGSNLPELRKSCCHLHIAPCHLHVLRRMLTGEELASE